MRWLLKKSFPYHLVLNTYDQLLLEVDRIVFLNNNDKSHIDLQRKSPIQFENDYFCKAKSQLSKTDGSGEPNY